MGRTVDQEVHAAFVEFRAKEDDKVRDFASPSSVSIVNRSVQRTPPDRSNTCSSVLVYAVIPTPPQPTQPTQTPNGLPTNGYPGTPNGPPGRTTWPNWPDGHSHSKWHHDHQRCQSACDSHADTAAELEPTAHADPRSSPGTSGSASSNLPAPPLDDVHAAFVEFRAKEEDKCLSVQCIYCQQVRAKNTSRQRQHLLECPTYLSVMKDSIPANNLLHTFPEGDVARSLQIPAPSLELDFRMSIKMNPKVGVGASIWGHREWVSYLGGQWAGRWGKGIVLPGGQDTQIVTKDSTTSIRANYLLQTADEPPAFIIIKADGWLTGAKDVLEKVNDSAMADGINPGSYKYRLNLGMETGDERYTFLNTLMWIGSGCRRGQEVIFDAFRVN
ncbi:hypothetical protein N7533_003280 [Penicillium manginii]|uniref:uncharacterized protein n=1 Tax=Penicillium manginii TaxID=203109 RepID=UPI002546FE8D|nr:uncharacterized protein N7533_003280 [Penicillium manginii]KAJ5764599.1 hypothetical protein N7533_003280 [Penicillium manginii]